MVISTKRGCMQKINNVLLAPGGSRPVTIQTFQLSASSKQLSTSSKQLSSTSKQLPNSSSKHLPSMSSSKLLMPAFQLQNVKLEPSSSSCGQLPNSSNSGNCCGQPRQLQTVKLEPGVTQPLPPHAHQPLKLEIQETYLDTGG